MSQANYIKSGTQIEKQCEQCQSTFIGWSDDTMTIKGKMHPTKLCQICHEKRAAEMHKCRQCHKNDIDIFKGAVICDECKQNA
jgi:hypothetical protein